MGFRIEIEGLYIPRELKKTVKLLESDKEYIRYLNKNGISQRKLAKAYGVALSTIQYTIHPEKYQEHLRKRREEKHSRKYFDSETNKEYLKKYRDRKNELYEEGLLISEGE